MSLDQWAFPVAAILLGWFAGIFTDWFRHRMTRDERRSDARSEFQRQTLLDLQNTLDELAFDAATIFALRKHSSRRHFSRTDIRSDNPHAEAVVRASIRFTSLAERVDNDELRTLLEQLDTTLREAATVQEVEQIDRAVEHFRSLRRQANERIGTLLRSL
jgi:hypothetical protein